MRARRRPWRPDVVDRLLGRPQEWKDGKGARGDRARSGDVSEPRDEVWRRVQLARNLGRPRTLDLLRHMADEVIELHGDRGFGDDPAMVAGFARIEGRRIAFVGQRRTTLPADLDRKRRFGAVWCVRSVAPQLPGFPDVGGDIIEVGVVQHRVPVSRIDLDVDCGHSEGIEDFRPADLAPHEECRQKEEQAAGHEVA